VRFLQNLNCLIKFFSSEIVHATIVKNQNQVIMSLCIRHPIAILCNYPNSCGGSAKLSPHFFSFNLGAVGEYLWLIRLTRLVLWSELVLM
jgi:hypothetical protein